MVSLFNNENETLRLYQQLLAALLKEREELNGRIAQIEILGNKSPVTRKPGRPKAAGPSSAKGAGRRGRRGDNRECRLKKSRGPGHQNPPPD